MRWVEPERRVRSELRSDLRNFLRLARLSHEFVEAAIGTMAADRKAKPTHAAEVQARLLVRISNELRVIELAALNSYVLQALGLASTVYELSAAMAFIGTSNSRAKQWEDHEDSRRSYPDSRDRRRAVSALIRALVPDVEDLEAAVNRHEALYEVFCMAKHGNPKALRSYGVAIRGDIVQLNHGPFVAPYIVRQAKFALFKSSWLVAGATVVFARPQLEGASATARARYSRVEARMGSLLDDLQNEVPS